MGAVDTAVTDVRIPVRPTLSSIDALLSGMETQEVGDLRFPTPNRVLPSGFSSEAALVQAIITWAQRSQTKILRTSYARENISRLVANIPGLVASLVAKDVVSNGKSLERDVWREKSKRLKVMEPYPFLMKKSLFGSTSFLLCADGIPRCRPSLLYHPIGVVGHPVREPSSFHYLVEYFAAQLGLNDCPKKFTEGLGWLVYELFKNTDEWAQHDSKGWPVNSLRGIFFYVHKGEEMARRGQGLLFVEDYFKRSVPIIEVSVFDGGAGIASRLSGKSSFDDIDLEYASLVHAFKSGVTLRGDLGYGVGLTSVMRTLSRAGCFLFVRSGRLALYRNFEQEVYEPEPHRYDTHRYDRPCPDILKGEGKGIGPYFRDWSTGELTPKQAPSVQGTLFTVLCPVRNY